MSEDVVCKSLKEYYEKRIRELQPLLTTAHQEHANVTKLLERAQRVFDAYCIVLEEEEKLDGAAPIEAVSIRKVKR